MYILPYIIKSLFPTARLVGGGCNPLASYYNVLFESPISDEVVTLIEEHYRAYLTKPIEPKLMEMVPKNASELLRHHNEPIRAEAALRADEPLVQVVQIGKFYDYVEEEIDLTLPKMAQVVECETIEGVTRFWVVEADSNETLKNKLKQWHHAEKVRSDLCAPKLGLYIENDEGIYWSPKGMWVREQIIDLWKEGMKQLNIELVKSATDLEAYCALYPHARRIAQIDEEDQILLIGANIDEERHQLEKLLKKIWKLCHLESSDYLIEDALMTPHEMATFEQEGERLKVSLIPSLTQLINLAIEKNDGQLPFALEPAQVVVGMVKKSFESVAQKLVEKLAPLRVHVVKNMFKTKHDASRFAKKQNCPHFFLIYEENEGYYKARGEKKFEALEHEQFVKCVLKSAKKS